MRLDQTGESTFEAAITHLFLSIKEEEGGPALVLLPATSIIQNGCKEKLEAPLPWEGS